MSKILKRLRKDKGEVFENEFLKIETKYSEEATEKELIKFTSKDGEPIIFSAGEMLDMIREQYREKNLAASLTTADTTFIPSVEAAVPISFNANKDIKELQKIVYDNLQASMLGEKTVDQAIADAAQEWDARSVA